MSEGATRCAHCGLPSPPVPEGPSFCCRGCHSAYALLHEMGLTNYYGLREQLAPELQVAVGDGSASRFDHLDDGERQARLGNAEGEALLGLDGLHCAACVWVVEEMGHRIPGVDEMRVDLASARLRVSFDPKRVRLSEVAEKLATLGYTVQALDASRERQRQAQARKERWRLAIAGASAGNVMLFSIALYLADFGSPMAESTRSLFEWSAFLATLPALLYSAWPFYRGALAGLQARRLHMDLPISIGLLVGFAASTWALLTGRGELYFDSGTTLVFLLLLGRHIQRLGNREALSEAGLMELLLPATALRIGEDGKREQVDAGRLGDEDLIEVHSGERLPADGQVTWGEGFVDASTLTGEAVPVHVEVGSTVHAGTIYQGAPLRVRVSAVGAATRVGKLARRIVDAAAKRPKLQSAVDRLTGTFSAAVLTAAVVAAGAWWMIDPDRVLPVVISLLVISCPCALGLATPVVLAIARARAARGGLLLHEAEIIEALGEVRRVVFDKTGTLTQGQPSVRWSELPESWIPYVGALEHGDNHPLARALNRWSGGGEAAASLGLEHRQVHPGKGISGRVGGRELRVGAPAWLGLEGSEGLGYCLSRAWTPVAIEVDGELVGVLGVGDALRPEAKRVLAGLRAMGLEPVIASGDHPSVVESIARELGIAEYHGAMSPEDKATLVGDGRSFMVGDGINDAPALRAARVGLAMGGGAEVALEVADATSLEEGLGPVHQLFEGAARARRAVRFNLGFALSYNLLFATLAALGWVTPLVAAIIMPLSSISVVLAAIWTRTFDPWSSARGVEQGGEPSAQRLQGPVTLAASHSAPQRLV